MSEKFEPEENKEDVADLMSSLIRELAESGGGSKIAQMVQNAKGLWIRGEHAAAYWMLQAFELGQEDVLHSSKGLDSNGIAQIDLTKRVCENDEGLYQKFSEITREMGQEVNGEK
jgi:hypothetical protein